MPISPELEERIRRVVRQPAGSGLILDLIIEDGNPSDGERGLG